MILKLGMKHLGIDPYKVYINHEPVMTLTYFMALVAPERPPRTLIAFYYSLYERSQVSVCRMVLMFQNKYVVKTSNYMFLISVDNLMVSGISFSNIATDRFTVSWTGPTRFLTHVSRYGVSWTPATTSTSEINTGKVVSTTVTRLTPGAVYNVTVATYNDVTQNGETRSISTFKQHSSSKLFLCYMY